MANPRQRRKARSSVKIQSQSKQSKKHSKKIVARGPEAFVSAWDPRKTVKQNYTALGLLNDLPLDAKTATAIQKQQSQANAGTDEVPEGYARIERDEQGKIVNIVYGKPAAEKEPETAWGKSLNGGEQESARIQPATETARQLEEQASRTQPKVSRHLSTIEKSWLQDLTRAHGDDIQAMAHDLKLNIWQKTPGEISKAIKKAGGIDALKA